MATNVSVQDDLSKMLKSLPQSLSSDLMEFMVSYRHFYQSDPTTIDFATFEMAMVEMA